MKIRVISGIVIGLVLAAMLLSPPVVTAIVLCVIALIAYREVVNAMQTGSQKDKGKIGPFELAGYIGIIVLYTLLAVGKGLFCYIFVLLAVFSVSAVLYVFLYPRYSFRSMVEHFFAFVYPAVMLSFIYMMRTLPGGNYLAWVPFMAWICDTCAYFTGRALGKHKLCPQLSPKKTVEGAIGGVLGCIVAGVIFAFIYARTLTEFTTGEIVLAMVVITAVAGSLSQVGDLVASGLKRERGIKDYGRVIPGHGGIMDRFDSVIFISPFVYFLTLFLLYGKELL